MHCQCGRPRERPTAWKQARQAIDAVAPLFANDGAFCAKARSQHAIVRQRHGQTATCRGVRGMDDHVVRRTRCPWPNGACHTETQRRAVPAGAQLASGNQLLGFRGNARRPRSNCWPSSQSTISAAVVAACSRPSTLARRRDTSAPAATPNRLSAISRSSEYSAPGRAPRRRPIGALPSPSGFPPTLSVSPACSQMMALFRQSAAPTRHRPNIEQPRQVQVAGFVEQLSYPTGCGRQTPQRGGFQRQPRSRRSRSTSSIQRSPSRRTKSAAMRR